MNFDKLFSNIESLLNLDKTKIAALNRLKIFTGIDLLLFAPFRYKKSKIFPTLDSIKHSEEVYLRLQIDSVVKPAIKSRPTEVYASNESGNIKIIFFRFHGFLDKIIKPQKIFTFQGKAEVYNSTLQITHPEIIYDAKLITEIEPVYHLTYAITNNQLRNYIHKLSILISDLKIGFDDFLIKHNMPTISDSFRALHSIKPVNTSIDNAVKSLKYFEAYSNQLGFKHLKNITNKNIGRQFVVNKIEQDKIVKNLGFSLTNGQKMALSEIQEDQKQAIQMLRMLQGDVGCGKTLVAILSSLNVLSSGGQVAIMAPTEVLAQQHYNSICKILDSLDYKISILTSKIKGKQRNQILRDLENGDINLIVGTHSLIQEKVKFKDLSYVVVDEQHKFGVNQRMNLTSKGNLPDILVMSATPIPRTLSLSMFGDLSMSLITTMPKQRKPIKTYVMPISKTNDVISSLSRIIEKNQKIYWICPLIEKNEEDLEKEEIYIDVETRYQFLTKIYGDKVGFLHGNLSSDDKEKIINSLRDGEINILVSTTVIEVGIDISDASLIIIENAEKFGLAQLHQLRGRVGRGEIESTCILIYGKRTSKIAFERLKIMRESNDGFYISEEDLKLRGEGELLGEKQSGTQNFIFLDLLLDSEIIYECYNLAKDKIITQDEIRVISTFNQSIFKNNLLT